MNAMVKKASASYNEYEVDACGSCRVVWPSGLIEPKEDTFDYLSGKPF